MPFSKEDKALTTNLYQFKKTKTRFTEDSDGICNDKLQKGSTGHLSEKPSGNKKHSRKHKSGRPKRTEEKLTTVNELVGLLNQEGQKQTLRSARQISR